MSESKSRLSLELGATSKRKSSKPPTAKGDSSGAQTKLLFV